MADVQPFPTARTASLVVQATGSETLIHDERAGHFHTLNANAAAIWRHCDGTSDPATIAVATGLPLEVVELGLVDLADLDLLVRRDTITRMERRAFLKRAMVAGVAGGVILPAIASITTNQTAVAASCLPCNIGVPQGHPGCFIDTDCCGGPQFTFVQCDIGNNPHDCLCT